jgi:hypothetical protein
MKFDQNDAFVRVTLQYCPAMVLFFQMLSASEHMYNMSTPGKENEIEAFVGRIADASYLGTRVILSIRFNGENFYKKDILMIETMNLQFKHASEEKWLREIDGWFKDIMLNFFTAGLFSMCRVHLTKNGEGNSVMEEQDVETL